MSRTRLLAWISSAMLGALGCAAVAAPARAGIVSDPVTATVQHPGLTTAERQALTITSLTAASDPQLGLVVTATFQGDVERYLGQGHLKAAMLALILTPAAATETPPGMIDQGGGYTTTRFATLVRHGKRLGIKRHVADVFSPEYVLPTFTGAQYGAVRDGDQAVFRIAGPVLADAAAITLKAFVRSPLHTAKNGPAITPATWRAVLGEQPADQAELILDPSLLTTAQLATVASGVSSVLSGGIEPELTSVQSMRGQLRTALHQYPAIATLAAARRDVPLPTNRTLLTDFENTGGRIARLHAETAALDTFGDRVQTLSAPAVEVTQTDPGLGQELAAQPERPSSTIVPQGLPVIDVNPQLRYQQFTGIGAAITDSSAWLIYDELPATTRLALLQALFGTPGSTNSLGLPAIHLNFLRVGIGAPGAMTVNGAYSYDDDPPGGADPTLANFSIAHDLPYIIPTLQQALSINPQLEILASPWSPPAWMKSENSLADTDGNNTLLPAYYGTFASYIVKFIQAYEAEGIPITAITPENEPSSGQEMTQYPGLTLPESDEAQLIAQNLAPALQAAGLSTEIYGSDLSWVSAPYASALASGPSAGDLAGLAWHCYFGSPAAMSAQHQATPNLDQIVDECAPEIRSFGTPEFLISSLRNWASAVSVWSVALDPNGQPIQAGNSCTGCRGPVQINEQTGAVTLRPEYYQLGQVSAFVQPGATRVDSPSFVTYGLNASGIETVSAGLDDVAFQNPDGSLVLVTENTSTSPVTFAVDSGGRYFTYTLPAAAMTTFVWH